MKVVKRPDTSKGMSHLVSGNSRYKAKLLQYSSFSAEPQVALALAVLLAVLQGAY